MIEGDKEKAEIPDHGKFTRSNTKNLSVDPLKQTSSKKFAYLDKNSNMLYPSEQKVSKPSPSRGRQLDSEKK